MARIRTVKPEFWSDEKLADCSKVARLVFIGTLNFVDDEGRLEYSPKRLKMQLFPGDTDTTDIEVAAWVGELVRVGVIVLYRVGDRAYLQIPNFKKHQRVDHPRPSVIPAPPKTRSEKPLGSLDEPAASTPGTLQESSLSVRSELSQERKGTELMGKEISPRHVSGGAVGPTLGSCQESDAASGSAPGSPVSTQDGCAILPVSALKRAGSGNKPATPTADQVDRIYRLYPRRIAPGDAKVAIGRAVAKILLGDSNRSPMTLVEALEYLCQRVALYAQSVQGQDPKYIPHPATWFNGDRFWDDICVLKPERGGMNANGGFHHHGDDLRYAEGADYVFNNND